METEFAEYADITLTRADIRSGYRYAGIGAAAGVGVHLTLDTAFTVLTGRSVNFSPALVAEFALIGATFGMLISLARIERRKREVTGVDFGTRRRIKRAVLRGKPDELSDEEQRRAVRYAAIVTLALPYQAVQSVTLLASLLLSDVGKIFWPPRGIGPFSVIDVLLITVNAVLVVLVPATMLRSRSRARRWASMHTTG